MRFYAITGYWLHKIQLSVETSKSLLGSALKPNFSQKPFSSKVDQRSLQSAYPNNDLCEMRITASSFTDPPRITNELPEARVLVLNDIEALARRSLPHNRLKYIWKRNVPQNIIKRVCRPKIVSNASQTRRQIVTPRNAHESSNPCSYPNTGYWLH